jgi:hypothetical protein
MVREVFVAETDAEAERLSVGLHMGRMMREYFLPLLANFDFLALPEARPERARQRRHAGILRQAQLDHRFAGDGRGEDREDPRRGRRLRAVCLCSASTTSTTRRHGVNSLELLAKEVLPKVKHLKPKMAKLAAE